MTAILNQRKGKRLTKKLKHEFIDALKVWCAANELSQSQAAEHLGVPLRTLQNWEIARAKRRNLRRAPCSKSWQNEVW